VTTTLLVSWRPCRSSQASNGSQKEEKKFLQGLQLHHQREFRESLHKDNHDSVLRIFVGLSWELYCHLKSKWTLKQWQLTGRKMHS